MTFWLRRGAMPTADGRFKGISVPRYPTVEICPERGEPCGECMVGGIAHAHCMVASGGTCKGCPDVEHCASGGCAVGKAKASMAKAAENE